MSIDSAPFTASVIDGGEPFANGWVVWITKLQMLAGTLSDSGTTANRPTKNLWIGRRYFDTTLGYMIWVKDSTPTWVNGAGIGV